jgi:hypothetical protein
VEEKSYTADARASVLSRAFAGSVAFTMDVYSHIISDMQEDAMALLDEVLPEGVSGTRASRRQSSLMRASVAQW